jgi:hypothetical protein
MLTSASVMTCYFCFSVVSNMDIAESTDSGRTCLCPQCEIDALAAGRLDVQEVVVAHRHAFIPELRLLGPSPTNGRLGWSHAVLVAMRYCSHHEFRVAESVGRDLKRVDGIAVLLGLALACAERTSPTSYEAFVDPDADRRTRRGGHIDPRALQLRWLGFSGAVTYGARVVAGYQGEGSERRRDRFSAAFEPLPTVSQKLEEALADAGLPHPADAPLVP